MDNINCLLLIMGTASLDNKIAAAKEMVRTFRLERIVYVVVGVLSFLTLLGLGIYSYLYDKLDWASFSMLFLPTGVITFTTGRILKMFTDCLEFLKSEIK
jgi:hypothetical protein